jgi:hypothetical protein
MTDLHPRDVRDGVAGAWLEDPRSDTEVAGASASLGGNRWRNCGRGECHANRKNMSDFHPPKMPSAVLHRQMMTARAKKTLDWQG